MKTKTKTKTRIMTVLVLVISLFLFFQKTSFPAPGDTISKSIRVSWTANTEDDLAGYRVYLAKELLIEVPDPTATSVEIVAENLIEGENIFNLTAYDTSGNESFFSNDTVLVYDGTSPSEPSHVTVQTTPHTRVTIETWE